MNLHDNKAIIRNAKSRLIGELKKFQIDEDGNLIVAEVRKSRKGIVGYYSYMSQFRGRARIVVDVNEIRSAIMHEAEVERQVYKTIAHEYGHVLAEFIAFHAHRGRPLDVPDWRDVFGGDEEEFAEDFARFICGAGLTETQFHQALLTRLHSEFARLSGEQDEESLAEPAAMQQQLQ